MAPDLTFSYESIFSTQHAHLVDALYAEAEGARWSLPRERFSAGLRRSAEKRFGDGRCDLAEVHTYLRSLHLRDLALACACGEGIETAWEFFIAHFRQDLRGASRAILRASGSRNDAGAEELADSLYAELYGIRSSAGGRRKSLFEYFHGRSKLSTWLRAVLTQRYVDLLRIERGTISLDTGPESDEDAPPVKVSADSKSSPYPFAQRGDPAPADPDRARYLRQLDGALSVALGRLTPRERMLLACYYVDRLTLAEIGRTFREHESTVSRQLERTRCTLRQTVIDLLQTGMPPRDGHRADPVLDEAQMELAFEYALEDWPFDLTRALSKAEAPADPPER